MVQHHIQDHQVIVFGPDSRACGLLNVRMPKVDFVPVLLTDHAFRPIEHNGRVIDGGNMRKLGSQGIDKLALAGAYLKYPAAGGDLFIAEQVNNAAGILVEFGNQVLVLPQAFGVATKKCLRPRRPFSVNLDGAIRYFSGQDDAVNGSVQGIGDQAQGIVGGNDGASVKN